MPGRGIAAQVCSGHLVEATGFGRTEIEIDAIHIGGENEPIDLQPLRKQSRREIFIDHSRDAREAVSISNDRNAAAA